ncbi:MAG: hypothetical protein L6300_00570 [Syntrophaceae bacterium]|nr:hypothetical protein [Syntrophaceae bacterium]
MISTSHLIRKCKACFGILVWLWLATLVACSGKPVSSPTAASQPNFTSIVQDILSNPKNYAGKEVVIVGYYRGWNLLGEARGRSPVTRSDWVIKDNSGAIYVSAGGEWEGDVSLAPGSLEDTKKVLRLTGFVRLTAEGQPYIEPTQVELIP